jgi:glutathione S-transferase
MSKTTVWGFRWAPEFAQGLVRDLRVRWALEEAGKPYEVELIGFDDRFSAAYRERQPFGMVPAYEADGQRLFESGAIVHRIAMDSTALMPIDANARADVLAWMFAALNTVEPSMQNVLETDFLFAGEAWVAARRPGVIEAVNTRLATLSTRLEGRDYLLDRFSAADILMTTALRFIRHTDLVAAFPPVAAYVKHCEGRPAFRKALAAQMAEYVEHAPLAA